ncbi:hydantoinase B/oxoprolinase family protein [Bordetella sp. BOR01]|uniref:hydantoinase B/oxoprolinase family protein n=1 Tax=Bordetella sp. BOR01 TaxID=2854779 RepID=UPI001C455579|nr:hydantoinase B/oxoprolinase family protein [Bordetella sp. BOR01]MBV7482987.1 hydantoinase B/oxoprolinase family protein [Bordetella sp. BOR01]
MIQAGKRLSVGVDIGGTFTDIVVLDEDSREVRAHKELTTHDAPAKGVMQGLGKLFRRENLQLKDVGRLVHATTLFTNALIERRGARAGFITTEGFGDVIAIGRERKYDIYDLQIDIIRPLCDREQRYEVAERVDAAGNVLRELDLEQLGSVVDRAVEQGCESLAIGFLNAHVNPHNERLARDFVGRRHPALSLSISHEVANEIREYDRFSTAIANAYIQPLAEKYLHVLAQALRELGILCPMFVMRSNGGLATVEEAVQTPIHLLESGPAAGTLAAAYFARACEVSDFVALDLGGTTAKLCAIEGGTPLISHVFEAAREKRFVPESGLPIRIPTVDLIEIGAGGGGIARVDQLGLLKVGPTSAGSEPGPAAYGRGGIHPTVSDANLLLGYLNPGYFANGDIQLDTGLASRAVSVLADALRVQVRDSAAGIHDLANESMAAAARVHAAEHGRDPSRLALLVTGGGGPIHGGGVARKLGISTLICPAAAGVASAIGLVLAPIRVDTARFAGLTLCAENLIALQQAYDELRADAVARVNAMVGRASRPDIAYAAEMRYVGQGFEITVALDDALSAAEPLSAIRGAFEAQYQDIFGQVLPWAEIELTMVRLTAALALTEVDKPLRFAEDEPSASALQPSGERQIFLPGATAQVTAKVYRWESLPAGTRLNGPVVVEQQGSTLVLAAEDVLCIAAGGTAVVHIGQSAARSSTFDSINLEIFWRRLIAIVDEASATLVRSSFSTVVRESDDFSVVLTDAGGSLLAQGTKSIPVFIGSLPRTVRHFIDHFGIDDIHEGDVYVTNDAWMGTGHLSDINLAAPIFHDGRLVAFAASTAHAADIGGNSNAFQIADVFQEGFQIPIMKLRDKGAINESILQLLRKNVRAPEQVVGDLFGQISALGIIDRRLKTVMHEWKLETLGDFARETFSRTDKATREAIRRIPDGIYRAEQFADGMGDPLRLNAAVIVEGDTLTVDYAGTSPQIKAALNVAYCYTHGFTVYGLKCLLDPGSPNNEGSFRALKVAAPQGSVLNHDFPLSGGNRATVGHYLPSLVYQALAPAMPESVLASAGAPIWSILIKGRTVGGKPVMVKGFFNGGMGGSRARDGLSVISWPSNISGAPVEVMERLGPVRINYRRIRVDSGGHGMHRGGDGLETEVEVTEAGDYTLNMIADRLRHGAPGLFGGADGHTGEVTINGKPVNVRATHELKVGDRIVLRTPGGGGYGTTAQPVTEQVAPLAQDILKGSA